MSGVGSLVGKFVMYVSSIYSKVVGVWDYHGRF
jgi:hypothetical protein